MNLTDIFNSLFPAQETPPGETHSYELIRSDEYSEYFQKWSSSSDKQTVLSAFRLGYESFLNENSIHDLIELPTQSIFIFNNENDFINGVYLHHLIDHFKDKMMQNGYKSYFSDLRVTNFKEGSSRKIFRHYLKVSFDPTVEAYPTESLFGNIYFELVEENHQVVKLRIICNYIQQRNRDKEKSIHELIEFLVKE